jgi:hypothetical protein
MGGSPFEDSLRLPRKNIGCPGQVQNQSWFTFMVAFVVTFSLNASSKA